MKNLIVVLLLTMIAYRCSAQRRENTCVLCIQLQPSEHLHEILPETAAALIGAFQNKFKVDNFGGTIYGSVEDFKINTAGSGTLLLKYHLCTDGFNSTNLFLAFENEKCDAATTPPSSLHEGVLAERCKVSSDLKFPALAGNAVHYLPLEQHSRSINYERMQWLDSINVENCENFFNTNANFIPFTWCIISEGYFNFDKSIQAIYDAATASHEVCAGIRYYFGYEASADKRNKIRVILVGVDANGRNLNFYRENSLPDTKIDDTHTFHSLQ